MHSLEFMAEAQKVGWKPRFKQVARSDPDSHGGLEMLVGWLAKQRRDRPSARRSGEMFAAHDPGGPVCRTFMERFTVVEGTGGTKIEHAAIARLSEEFRDAWRKTHTANCHVTTDTALTETEQAGHLVLLGNSETNAIWKRLHASIPIGLHADRLEIAGKEWTGTGLGVQAVFRNPGIIDRTKPRDEY